MTPTKFIQANAIADCGEGRTMDIRNASGYVLSCWRPSLRERFSALFFGRVWLCAQLPEQPNVLLTVRRRVIE